MITIAEKSLYCAYRKRKQERTTKEFILQDLILPAIFVGSIGAITYAIRGTGGWGGFDGAVIPGMLMAISWYYILRRRGLNARVMVFWTGLAFATGGMWGYGQYASWIRGLNDWGLGVSINPMQGYIWFFISGITIGGAAGIVLGWSTGRIRMTAKRWLPRIIVPAGFVGLAYLFSLLFPSLLFPSYNAYIPGCDGCERTVFTNRSNFMVLMWYIGALVVALLQRDKNTIVCGLIIGLGFGFAQLLGGSWMLVEGFAPAFADWWKVWELTAGLLWGISNAIALHWIQEEFDKHYTVEAEPVKRDLDERSPEKLEQIRRRQRTTSNVLSWLALLSLLLVAYYGSTYYLGYNLGLYPYTTDQYDPFLPGRPILVIIGVIIILSIFAWRARYFMKHKSAKSNPVFSMHALHAKMLGLILFIFVIGIYTIWDAEKISILYAVYLAFALIALAALNNYYIGLSEKLHHGEAK